MHGPFILHNLVNVIVIFAELLPKKHFVVDGEIQNIVLEGCDQEGAHASQRFLNYVFKYLVGEIMGYNNITMATDCVGPSNYDLIMSRISGCCNVTYVKIWIKYFRISFIRAKNKGKITPNSAVL